MKDFDKKDNLNEPYQEFKDLFSEESAERKQQEDDNNFRKKMLPRYIIALAVYVIGMFLVGSIVLLLISSVPGTVVEVQPEEQVIISVATDNNGLAFILPESYDIYKTKYSKYVSSIEYNEYLVLVNINNYPIFEREWLIKNESDALVIKDEILNLYIAGELTKWDDARIIKLYLTSNEYKAYPNFITNFDEILHYQYLEPNREFSNGATSVANLITYVFLLGALGFILLPNIKKDLIPFREKDRVLIIGIVAGFGFIFGASMAANAVKEIIGLIFSIPGGESINQFTIEMSLKSSSAPLMIMSAVIFGPIVEELIFRKTFFELSKNKWLGLALSSLIFGLIHVSTELANIANFGHFLYVFIPYLFMGLGFGAAYIVYKQNVITVIGSHMLWNLFSVLVVFLL